MLTKRIAHYAKSRGIELPLWEDARIGEGLAGTLRVATELRVWARPDVEARLGRLDLLVTRFNEGVPSVRVRPGDGGQHAVDEFARGAPRPTRCALELIVQGWVYTLVPGGDGFQLIDAQREDVAPGRLLRLIARFAVGRQPGSDVEGIMRLIAARLLTTRQVRRLISIERHNEEFLLPYQRYVEALRDRLARKPPPIPYAIASRAPLQLAVRDDADERTEGWPTAFSLPRAQVTLSRASGRPIRFEVAEVNEERNVLTLHGEDVDEDPVLGEGFAQIADAAGPLRRMLEALEALAAGRHEAHLRLLDALLRPRELPPLDIEDRAYERLGERTPDNDAQHRAVALALASPDLCLIDGPPGTGKTTVICEIVRHLVARGERVLLVAPTHVALDHVLQRIGDEAGIYALRLGWPETVDPAAHRFLVERRGDSLRDRLLRSLASALGGADPTDPVAAVQRTLRDDVADDEHIGDLLLLNANLVCATPLGIAMTPAFREPEPAFDVLIMDEASKATVTDMLVPATRAERWILVGDHLQLSPYADARELEAIVAQRAGRSGEQPDAAWIEDVAWRLQQLFEQRAHPDADVRQRLYRSLADAAFPEEPDEVIDHLAQVDEGRWRALARGEEHAPAGVLDVARFRARARLVAEMLELRDVAMRSAFELARGALGDSSRRVSLDAQHRMHPKLAEFSRQWVYAPRGLEYRSSPNTAGRGLLIPSLEEPAIWIDTAWADASERHEHPRDGTWQSGRYENRLEVDVAVEVVETCIRWAAQSHRASKEAGSSFQIGVVTFYLTQARLLRDALHSVFVPDSSGWRGRAQQRTAGGVPIDIHVSLVDRFQGQEKDIIVVSATRSNPMFRRGHVNNLNRLNVAVTRAHHKRIVIGDSSTLALRGDRERMPGDLLRELLVGSDHKRVWGRRLGRYRLGGR
ncbi:hypothetical protein BE04_37730 [Sorangium cellulosum]|uniref:AAA+ ATPase domain-containing protein n=1 Tax=Sorangium cellulosum TaxID=56 RepID=A0A150P0V7_SORCE|nr:hypothetical protein BE04_37730 [Sorangium cellulosum]